MDPITSTDNAYFPIVDEPDQALCHLFFHCCLEDEQFTASELNALTARLVQMGVPPRIDIKKELVRYLSYKPAIRDEQVFIRYMFRLISPVNELALYSYCTELLLDDPASDPRKNALLKKIAVELNLTRDEVQLVNLLIAQRKAVASRKMF